MDYGTCEKSAHRHALANYAAQLPPGPVYYLDDPTGGCTRQLHAEGIPMAYLRPVNWDPAAARAVFRATGVPCLCGDICALAGSFVDARVVWLDLETTSVPSETVEAAAEALAVGGVLAITVSARVKGATAPAQVEALRRALTDAGLKYMSGTFYVGKSGHAANMAVAWGQRRETTKRSRDDTPATPPASRARPSVADTAPRDLVGAVVRLCGLDVLARVGPAIPSIDRQPIYQLTSIDGDALPPSSLCLAGTRSTGGASRYTLATAAEATQFRRLQK